MTPHQRYCSDVCVCGQPTYKKHWRQNTLLTEEELVHRDLVHLRKTISKCLEEVVLERIRESA